MSKTKKIVLLVIHMGIAITTLLLTIKGMIFGAVDGQLGGDAMKSIGYFRAFTTDSNNLAGITSFILAIILIINLIKNKSEIPYWAVLLHYVSAVALGLTFLTTALFLAPSQVVIGNSYWLYFSQDMFFFHFLTPVLTILTFIFGEKKTKFTFKETILGLIPLVIYSAVYVNNAVIIKIWPDFYGFTFGGHMGAVVPMLILIHGVTFGISMLMSFCHNEVIRVFGKSKW